MPDFSFLQQWNVGFIVLKCGCIICNVLFHYVVLLGFYCL